MWIYLGVLLIVLAPLLLGASALKRHIERADGSMRARIGEGGTGSGHRRLQQITDAHVDIVTYLLIVSLAFLYPVGVLQLEHFVTGADGNIVLPLLFGAAVLVWSGFRLQQRLRTIAKLRTGLLAQLEVASHVSALMQQGYYVFHEIPANGFQLDHVAVGRNGVFVVTVDSRRPPEGTSQRSVAYDDGRLAYADGADDAAIIEARGRAVWLETWLGRRLGQPCHPTPVLCLPGWHVELKTTPSFPIVNQKYLGWTIPGWQGEALDETQVQRVCALLEERCREPREPLAEAA